MGYYTDIYNWPLRFNTFYAGIVAAYTKTNNRCSKPCPLTFRGNVANDTNSSYNFKWIRYLNNLFAYYIDIFCVA